MVPLFYILGDFCKVPMDRENIEKTIGLLVGTVLASKLIFFAARLEVVK